MIHHLMTAHTSCRREAIGLATRVLECGDRTSTEAVVFVHGVPGSSDHWSDLLPAAGRLGRAVAFDLPGWGRADRAADWEYTTDGYANFIAGLLHELAITRAHLVLHDLGAVALSWAASHPDQLASVVLIDTGIALGGRWHPVGQLFRAPILGAIAERSGRLFFGTVLRHFEGRRVSKEALASMRAEYDRGGRRSLLRYYRATPLSAVARLAPVLRRLDRPALVIWGGRDRFFGPAHAEQQRQAFPRARVHVLDDSGHYPHLDDPARVADLVVPFLEEQLAPQRPPDRRTMPS